MSTTTAPGVNGVLEFEWPKSRERAILGEDFLRLGEVTRIVGPQGIGLSRLLHQLAFKLLSGSSPWPELKLNRSALREGILYLTTDFGAWRLKADWDAQGDPFPWQFLDCDIFRKDFNEYTLCGKPCMDKLIDAVNGNGAGLVILDPYCPETRNDPGRRATVEAVVNAVPEWSPESAVLLVDPMSRMDASVNCEIVVETLDPTGQVFKISCARPGNGSLPGTIAVGFNEGQMWSQQLELR